HGPLGVRHSPQHRRRDTGGRRRQPEPRRRRDRVVLLRAGKRLAQHGDRESGRRARVRRLDHHAMSIPQFAIVARTGHPDFLDLPWDEPLEEWQSARIVSLIRGISRHVVRFVEYDGALYALKELPARPARREWTLLRRLEDQGLPVVEAVGIVTNRHAD